ncbi:class II aldolase/adducin family protein [Lentzea sp. NPDC006480]|uniref:class II aldolase/adducin family protein n=1 Tax=Lentzea sp. NPDC006480 TaxID=3157176 RepID=UPI0033AF5614
MSVQAEGVETPLRKGLRTQVALAARALSLGGHDDFNQGQVSARAPGSDQFAIKAALQGFDECTPDDVVWASTDPARPPDPMAPPELPLHQAIYAARPDVNAIVHSHAPYTLVFGASDLELRPISHDGAFLTGRAGRFTDSSNTILDIEMGEQVALALGDDPCVLLRNHGGVVVGKSVRHATVYAYLLERACQLQLMAESALTEYHTSSWPDVVGKREFIYADLSIRSYWEYCVRRVRRTWPEAARW